ncbi:Uncharacterised protein [Vibrio cholerae]|nr:Uncharacterised protein [Vibrio cholerae]
MRHASGFQSSCPHRDYSLPQYCLAYLAGYWRQSLGQALILRPFSYWFETVQTWWLRVLVQYHSRYRSRARSLDLLHSRR